MSAHFLLLGFAAMVAMGAMYQLVPVVFLTPIWNEKFGFIQFFVTASGITSFAVLLGYKPNIAIIGAILAVIGVMMFIVKLKKTLNICTIKTVDYYFFIIAIFCLLFTIVI